MKLKVNNNKAVIESEFCITEPFKLEEPTMLARTGMVESGKGVYILTYILDETKKEKHG